MAARGLWMECLCIMHEAKPYGHLLINGEAVEDDVLARMVGAPVDEVRTLMSELRKAGVLSVTRSGVIFSRRMMKDHARAQKGANSARKRWSQHAENKEEKEPPNRVPNRPPITQKPEARYQKDNIGAPAAGSSAKSTKAKGHSLPDDWKPAEKHFTAAAKLGRDARWVQRQAEAMRNWALANAHQSNTLKSDWDRAFLNWIDTSHQRESPRSPATAPPSRPDASSVDWEMFVSRYRASQSWPSSLGPQPGYSGCRAPSEVLRAHGFGGEMGGVA
ncbi:hypothetical protein V5F29_08140 [Xanthobacter aminoxidans]|uniref:hypothetical protein n=1 Tax=Xanthobacter aminoxidans TaxID=186280 RepID=UPI003726729D